MESIFVLTINNDLCQWCFDEGDRIPERNTIVVGVGTDIKELLQKVFKEDETIPYEEIIKKCRYTYPNHSKKCTCNNWIGIEPLKMNKIKDNFTAPFESETHSEFSDW